MAMDLHAGSKRGRVEPSMNVTPLVDVVLVLLIIFMVVTPMLVKRLSVNIPVKDDQAEEAAPPSPEPEPQVMLTVAADGGAYINRSRVADAHLETRLRRVFAARSDQTLFFDAASSVAYGRAMEVLDIARGTGIRTIAVVTEPLVD